MSNDILGRLEEVLEARKQGDPGSSYVASLHAKGLDKILEKVGEEAIEAILAAKQVEATGERTQLVKETADLWFHSLVMLSHLNISSQDVLEELNQRFGTSGLEEKAQRK